MPISTKLFNDQAIARFNQLIGDIQNTQGRIATGKNILRASDDPVAAANVSFTRDQKVMLDRFNTNIDRARTRLNVTENVLTDSTNVLTRAYELALQGRNDTLSAVDRKAIAREVTQLKNTVMALANSRDASGNFMFSGFKLGTKPFKANEDGVIQYHGDRGAHSVQISEGLRLRSGVDGATLFLRVPTQTGGQDVFGILEKLESDLNSGYVDAASVDDLDSSIQHFSIQQTRVGAELNKADLQQTALEKRILLMDENLSNLEDADLASLVTELQSQIVSRDAAQQAFVKIGQQSLFDFIR